VCVCVKQRERERESKEAEKMRMRLCESASDGLDKNDATSKLSVAWKRPDHPHL
jgi:hypothetical protein